MTRGRRKGKLQGRDDGRSQRREGMKVMTDGRNESCDGVKEGKKVVTKGRKD